MLNTLLSLFLGQALTFLIVVINIRAVSRGFIFWTIVTDFIYCYVNALMIQQLVSTPDNQPALLAYAMGGAFGSGIAIRLTRKWDNNLGVG